MSSCVHSAGFWCPTCREALQPEIQLVGNSMNLTVQQIDSLNRLKREAEVLKEKMAELKTAQLALEKARRVHHAAHKEAITLNPNLFIHPENTDE